MLTRETIMREWHPVRVTDYTTGDLAEWLLGQQVERAWAGWHGVYYFESPADACLFALKWG